MLLEFCFSVPWFYDLLFMLCLFSSFLFAIVSVKIKIKIIFFNLFKVSYGSTVIA